MKNELGGEIGLEHFPEFASELFYLSYFQFLLLPSATQITV